MSWFRRTSSSNSTTAAQTAETQHDKTPTPDNKLLFQAFEWHTPSQPPAPHETHSQHSHWSRITRVLPSLAELGVSSVWLPPGCKANNPKGNGYDCYDLWDLGEFDQKWARSTKWGSREELGDLFATARRCGDVELIWDAVLNHKTAGDATEETWAVEVDGGDRRIETSAPRKIEAWLKYEFPGREREGMRYSGFKWRAEHFNGTDWDQRAQKNAIYKLIDDPATFPKPVQNQSPPPEDTRALREPSRFSRFSKAFPRSAMQRATPSRRPGKGWAEDVDKMFGNHDYLMFSNIYYAHPEVRKDVLQWGQWMVEEVGIHGFRLDAAQHFSWTFTRDWIHQVQTASQRKRGRHALVIGEAWAAENSRQTSWLDAVTLPGSQSPIYAYDAPLLYNFARISEDVRTRSPNADLRTILTGPGNPEKRALMAIRPHQAVTLVTSHDTQPGQAMSTPLEPALKALFYAFILLRREGLPCVFWGDMYGTKGPKSEPPACQVTAHSEPAATTIQSPYSKIRSVLPSLMLARKLFAYGSQKDYFESSSCIGWTRSGTHDRPGCVVIMSILSSSKWASKRMMVGRPGETWVDLLGDDTDTLRVEIDKKGFGVFCCKGTGVNVYVRDDAENISKFPVGFNHDVYAG